MKINKKPLLSLVFLCLVFIVTPVFATPSIMGGIPSPSINTSGSAPTAIINNSYYLRDTSLPITGQEIRRNLATSNLNLFGGTNAAGQGGIVSVQGADLSGDSIVFYVPDTMHTANLIAAKFVGLVNFPYLDMNTHQIKSVKDPTDPQDATTLAYEDARPMINSSYAEQTELANYLSLDGTSTMTGDLNLGNTNMTNTGYIDLVEIAPPSQPSADTLRLYAEDYKGFSFFSFIDDTGMVRKIVRDSVFPAYNGGGSAIPAFRAVYADGNFGDVPTIALAKADADATMPAIGITTERIESATYGRVMQVGLLENVNVDGFPAGDVIYVSPTVAGGWTNITPVSPYLMQEIGTVLANNGATGTFQVVARSMFNTSWVGLVNESYAYLPGRVGGQILNGGTLATDNLTLNGTISSTKTFGNIILNPNAGYVGVNNDNPIYPLDIIGNIRSSNLNTENTNTSVGISAGFNNKGSDIVAVGYQAGYNNVGNYQTAFGYQAGYNNSVTDSTQIGYLSGYNNTGLSQTSIGYWAGANNKGTFQTVMSYNAGRENIGNFQTAIGYESGYHNVGDYQTALGYDSGYENTGSEQLAIGYSAGYKNIGILQTTIGSNSGRNNTGTYQTSIGNDAGRNNAGNFQTAIGYQAGYNNTGLYQTVIGYLSGYKNAGNYQTAIGRSSGYNNTGTFQAVLGYLTGYFNTGDYQVAMGYHTGRENTGDYQTALGYRAGFKNIGDNTIFIGYQAGTNNQFPNIFQLNQSNVNAHALISGNFSSGQVRFDNYGAGTATFDAGGNITSVSDEKFKTDIVPFRSGLDAILDTTPKQFRYSASSGLDTENVYTGFVAQELKKSIPEAVYSKPDYKYEVVLAKKGATNDDDEFITREIPLGTETYSIDDRAIIATLVNAVKEQQVEIQSQQMQIDNLTLRIKKLEAKVGA